MPHTCECAIKHTFESANQSALEGEICDAERVAVSTGLDWDQYQNIPVLNQNISVDLHVAV